MRLFQINIENQVGVGLALALDQIHQQEGEVVEQVAGGNDWIKLERVERHRASIDQGDVAEVQIAVSAADQPLFSAFDQERTNTRESGAAASGQRVDGFRLE